MTLNQLKNAIISELSSRSLKDPQIRENDSRALRRKYVNTLLSTNKSIYTTKMSFFQKTKTNSKTNMCGIKTQR